MVEAANDISGDFPTYLISIDNFHQIKILFVVIRFVIYFRNPETSQFIKVNDLIKPTYPLVLKLDKFL